MTLWVLVSLQIEWRKACWPSAELISVLRLMSLLTFLAEVFYSLQTSIDLLKTEVI